jgi:protein-S-isoprenylcysteine O-methyltransferase Ste14
VSHHLAEPATTTRRHFLVPLGNFLFRHRNAVFPLVFLAIVLLDSPRYLFGSPAWDRVMDGVGIAIAGAGQLIRIAVIGLAYIRRGGRDGRVYADELVTAGLFAHSRNPLYVGNMAVFVGLFVILNSRLGWLLGVPFVFVGYASLVRAEEDFLRRKFGAPYEDYCRNVNRFIPSLRGIRSTLSSMRFNWRRVVVKEYGSTWTWLTVVIALLFWERVVVEGVESIRGDAPAYVSCWLGVTFLYGVARFLKKSRRL